jgi:hypothetical protein
MSEKTKGLYNKFFVIRTDGSSEKGCKHHNCHYFVIDITHDKYAKYALNAYADACEAEFPNLANDLRNNAKDKP